MLISVKHYLAHKYKLRQSVKLPKEAASSQDRGYKTYKEKAKLYYSSMNYGTPQLMKFKNNWTGESKENIKHFNHIKIQAEDIKSKTANLVITAGDRLSQQENPSRGKPEKHKQ
jgi:uncharacterized ubiquitin-like protein YukD